MMRDLGRRALVASRMVRSMKISAEPAGMPRARASILSSRLILVKSRSLIM